MRLNGRWMACFFRSGGTLLLLLLLAGCSAAVSQPSARSATSEQTAPGSAAPGDVASGAPALGRSASGSAAPGDVASGARAPGGTAPQFATLAAAAPVAGATVVPTQTSAAPQPNPPTVVSESAAVPAAAQVGDPPATGASAASLARSGAVPPGAGVADAVPADSAQPASTQAFLAQAASAQAASAQAASDQPASEQAAADPACDDTRRPDPLPTPGSPESRDFFRSFRTPLAPAPLYDPPGPRRVGLQAGHWLTEEVPPELGRLQGGAVGGGKQEWEVNLDVARRAAALLDAASIQVDVLPATVPRSYRANAFIALHADGDPAGMANGFKVARPGFSSLPDIDDRLVDTLNQVYAADTELPRDDDHISLRMRYYYAFNSRRYCHAVAPGVPQAIVEMGYLTSPLDRHLLIGDPDRLARGLADAIQTFLTSIP